jgi:hypothetical protein
MAPKLESAFEKSKNEYLFETKDESHIIRVASYHREDYDTAVIHFPSHEQNVMKNTNLAESANFSTLGDLQLLPVELLHMVFEHFNAGSIFRFRHVNRRAAALIAEFPPFKLVVSHALGPLRALLQTGISSRVSLAQIVAALRTRDCEICGSFGGFVWLFQVKRCCFRCIRDSDSLRLVRPHAARSYLKLSAAQLREYQKNGTVLRARPGDYTVLGNKRKGGFNLMSIQEIDAFFVTDSTTISARCSSGFKLGAEDIYQYFACIALPFVDRAVFDNGVSCAGCQAALSVRVGGLITLGGLFRARNDIYSQEGFLDHFRWCHRAQMLWLKSKGGIVDVKEPVSSRVEVYLGEYFMDKP